MSIYQTELLRPIPTAKDLSSYDPKTSDTKTAGIQYTSRNLQHVPYEKTVDKHALKKNKKQEEDHYHRFGFPLKRKTDQR